MPKPGFKSFAIKEELYKFWKLNFEKNKEKLRIKGITSFSGYVSSLMNKNIVDSRIQIHDKMVFSKVFFKDDKLVLKDNLRNRIAELSIVKGKLFCHLDNRNDCEHIGFAYGDIDVINFLEKCSNH